MTISAEACDERPETARTIRTENAKMPLVFPAKRNASELTIPQNFISVAGNTIMN
jgi:hypothetical protein